MTDDKPKFTPGPWAIYDTRERPEHAYDYYITAGSLFVASISNNRLDIQEANAALIAAAPEMYNAEKDKVVHLRTLKNQICHLLAPEKDTVVTLDFVLTYIDEIICDTENLLAKARGEDAK